MDRVKGQNYMHGAAILTIGVIIMKLLGFIYKIPLGNILGDEGYGYFSVAYNIYNVFLTMATAGMPVALSRMISEADTLGRPMQVRKIFRVAWLTFAIFGILLGLVMFLFPTELAGMLNNVRAAQSIWALSPALVLVYLTSTYRGYAQGMSNMKPTTVSQILEVVGKVAVGLVLAWSFTRAGRGLPVASAGAIFGVTAGGAFALIYISLYKHHHYPDKPVADPDVPESAGRILGTLLRISIPIALGSSVLSIINLIDTKLIMYRLQTAPPRHHGGRQRPLRRLRQGADALQSAGGVRDAYDDQHCPGHRVHGRAEKIRSGARRRRVGAAYLGVGRHADGRRARRALRPDRERALSEQQ